MKHIRLYEEHIPGGRASGMTLAQIAASHGVDIKDIQRQLAVGIEVEMEHTDSREKAEEIAMDHVSEEPQYYTKLIRDGLVDEPAALKKYKEMYEGDWFDSHPDHPANQGEAREKMIDYPASKVKFSTFSNLHPALTLGLLKGEASVGGGIWIVSTDEVDEDYKRCIEIGDDEWDCEVVEETLENYATDLYEDGQRGEGLEAWEDGIPLVKVDEEMREYLIDMMESALRPSHRWRTSERRESILELKKALWELPKAQL
jgi:hypothetical protein